MSQDDSRDQARQAGANIWETIKRTGGSAADAAQRALQVQRLSAQIRKMESQQRRVVFTIGQKVYELHGLGKVRNKDVLNECIKIDELSEQIELVKSQIEQIRAEAKERPEQELEDSGFLTEEVEDTDGEAEVEVEMEVEVEVDEATEPADQTHDVDENGPELDSTEKPAAACCVEDESTEDESGDDDGAEDVDIELGPTTESGTDEHREA